MTMPRPSLVTSSGPSPVRGFMAAMGYGMNEELSDEDKMSVMHIRTYGFTLPSEARMQLASLALEWLTFPGYYAVMAWKKNQD